MFCHPIYTPPRYMPCSVTPSTLFSKASYFIFLLPWVLSLFSVRFLPPWNIYCTRETFAHERNHAACPSEPAWPHFNVIFPVLLIFFLANLILSSIMDACDPVVHTPHFPLQSVRQLASGLPSWWNLVRAERQSWSQRCWHHWDALGFAYLSASLDASHPSLPQVPPCF